MIYGITREEALLIVKYTMAKTEWANLGSMIARMQEMQKGVGEGYADLYLRDAIKHLQDAQGHLHDYIFTIEGLLPNSFNI
jgi:hypothetical protein